jgi:hypothetical protein
MVEKTPLFESKMHDTNIRGWLQGKNDNIVYVQDISSFVKNYRENKFVESNPNLMKFYTNLNEWKDVGRNHIFLGLFNGFDGNLVSKYLSQTIVFELFTLQEYQKGLYEEALIKLFSIIQKYPFNTCAKSTASIALITPEWTYFASVGDNPILLCSRTRESKTSRTSRTSRTSKTSKTSKTNKHNPFIVHHLGANHTRSNPKCIENIVASNIDECFLPSSLGFIGCNDLYNPPTFNKLIDTAKLFCNAYSKKLDFYIFKKKLVAKFRRHLKKKNDEISNFDDEFLDNLLIKTSEEKEIKTLVKDPITRTPLVKSIKNKHIVGFALVSNNAVESKPTYQTEPLLEKLIFRQDFEKSLDFCSKLLLPSTSSNHSGFLCWFKK